MNPLLFFVKLRARYRIFWSQCPACHGDAPAIDTCWCCKRYRDDRELRLFPPTEEIRDQWRFAFGLISDEEFDKRMTACGSDIPRAYQQKVTQ